MTTQNIMEFVLKFGIRYVPTLIPPLVHILSGITPEELYPVRIVPFKRIFHLFNFYIAFHYTCIPCDG